jgi:hypothetical protein
VEKIACSATLLFYAPRYLSDCHLTFVFPLMPSAVWLAAYPLVRLMLQQHGRAVFAHIAAQTEEEVCLHLARTL